MLTKRYATAFAAFRAGEMLMNFIRSVNVYLALEGYLNYKRMLQVADCLAGSSKIGRSVGLILYCKQEEENYYG
jgi:hypothetical protein